MINLFCGYDSRESIGFHVFTHSVIQRATCPVRIVPMAGLGLPAGSNSFTLSRFLVPYLCGFRGRAIFADASDMLMLGDIAELDGMFDSKFAVQVVKRADYTSRHDRKYIGTAMECGQTNYSRKNWASLMLINCEHWAWKGMNPATIERTSPLSLLQLEFCANAVGDLPPAWNSLVDEGDEVPGAGLLHWTAGIPGFPHYSDSPGADLWLSAKNEMMAVD